MGYLLVIEDDLALRQVLEEVLQFEKVPARLVATTAQALAYVEKEAPCMALLDYVLERGTSKEFSEWLQNTHPSIPIMLMSAMKGTKEAALGLKIKYYIDKPFDLDALMTMVRDCISSGNH